MTQSDASTLAQTLCFSEGVALPGLARSFPAFSAVNAALDDAPFCSLCVGEEGPPPPLCLPINYVSAAARGLGRRDHPCNWPMLRIALLMLHERFCASQHQRFSNGWQRKQQVSLQSIVFVMQL